MEGQVVKAKLKFKSNTNNTVNTKKVLVELPPKEAREAKQEEVVKEQPKVSVSIEKEESKKTAAERAF